MPRPRQLQDLFESDNPVEARFALDYLTNLTRTGNPADIDESTFKRGATGWRLTCWVFRSWGRAEPELDAMDWLTMTRGKPMGFGAFRRFNQGGKT